MAIRLAFKYFTEERAQEPGGVDVDMSDKDLFLYSIQIWCFEIFEFHSHFTNFYVDYDWNEWLYAFKYFNEESRVKSQESKMWI